MAKARRSMRASKAAQVARAMREAVAGVQVTYADGNIELRAFASLAEAERLAEAVRPMADGAPEQTGVVAVDVLGTEAVRALIQRHGG